MYFECFVLPVPKTQQDKIMIKSLELKYQFGEDSKEEYNPIDKLVDIYNNLVGPEKLFTVEEYRDRVNNQLTTARIKQSMEKAEIMVEFLNFINKPGRYDIARDMKLDGQLQEIATFKKKLKDDKEWKKVYPAIFQYMYTETKGDRSRGIRPLLKLYDNNEKEFEEVKNHLINLAYQEDDLNKSTDIFEKEEKLKSIENTKNEYKKIILSANSEINIKNAQKKQNDIIKSAISKMKEIDIFELKYLNEELKNDFKNDIHKLESIIEIIKKGI